MMEGKKRKRGGCPKQDEKRESATGIRFTKSEYFKLKEKADKAGIGITTYIRKVALEGKVIARTNEEERHFYRQISGMSENLNQLTKKAHQEGILTAVFLFEKYRDKLERLPHCKNLDDLKNKLQKKGIETLYKYKGQTQELQGISFRIGAYKYKGSEIDRNFSLNSLQRTIQQQQKIELKPALKITPNDNLKEMSQETASKELHQKNSLLENLMKPEKINEQMPYELIKQKRKKKHSLRLH